MIARAVFVSALAVLGFIAVPGAAAQPSRFDVSGGYQITRAADQTFWIGWSAGVAGHLDDTWSLVAEITGARRAEEDADLGVDVTLSLYTLGGGVRWSRRRTARIVPFLQILSGATRLSAHAEVQGSEIGDAQVRFMLQPGGGVDMRLNDRLGLVGQADYRRVFLDDSEGESGGNQLRVFLGLRLR